ncbi:unnamed protein product [Chrysoparadoxa australica]
MGPTATAATVAPPLRPVHGEVPSYACNNTIGGGDTRGSCTTSSGGAGDIDSLLALVGDCEPEQLASGGDRRAQGQYGTGRTGHPLLGCRQGGNDSLQGSESALKQSKRRCGALCLAGCGHRKV